MKGDDNLYPIALNNSTQNDQCTEVFGYFKTLESLKHHDVSFFQQVLRIVLVIHKSFMSKKIKQTSSLPQKHRLLTQTFFLIN